MKRANRLRKRQDFRRVFRVGTSVPGRAFVVVARPRRYCGEGGPRVGISIRRKVGNAVVRNRIKRLVREAVRSQLAFLPPHIDMVVVARQDARYLSYAEVCDHLGRLFRRGRLSTPPLLTEAATGARGSPPRQRMLPS